MRTPSLSTRTPYGGQPRLASDGMPSSGTSRRGFPNAVRIPAKPNSIPGSTEKCSAFARNPVRLASRNRVRHQPGTVFAFTPKHRSPWPGIPNQSQILFNKTLEEARRLRARGGRAHARNLRARSALLDALPVTPSIVPVETTAEAIAVLDAQFPWLRGAEKRGSRNRPTKPPLAGDGSSR